MTDVAARYRGRLRRQRGALPRLLIVLGAGLTVLLIGAIFMSVFGERAPRIARPGLAPVDEQVASQFSVWDGSHRQMVREVKAKMHNPRSFEHADTRYAIRDGVLTVSMRFRGTNAFGGIVLSTAFGRFTLDGQTISVNILD